MSPWTRTLTDGGLLQRLSAPALRRRIVFTLLVLAFARCLTWAPIPGIDPVAYARLLGSGNGGLLLGSGAIERLSVVALGLGPYVSLWVLMEVFRGGLAETRVERIRLLGAVPLTIFQAYGVSVGLEAAQGLVIEPGWSFRLTAVMTLLAGSLLLIWLGSQITRRGLGPGVWVLFAAGIAAELPSSAFALVRLFQDGSIAGPLLLGVIAIAAAAVALIVFVETAERVVLVEPAQAGSPATERLAFTLDHATIVPAYLASSMLLLPVTVAYMLASSGSPPGDWLARLVALFQPGQPLYLAFYATLIFCLTFLMTAMRVRLDRVAARLARGQLTIAGVPAAQTERHLDRVLTRLIVVGAVYLVFIALLPEVLISQAALPLYIGGTPLLIVVLVALHILRDVSRSVPSQPASISATSSARAGL
jgi:preprotein translocase subunit SecY